MRLHRGAVCPSSTAVHIITVWCDSTKLAMDSSRYANSVRAGSYSLFNFRWRVSHSCSHVCPFVSAITWRSLERQSEEKISSILVGGSDLLEYNWFHVTWICRTSLRWCWFSIVDGLPCRLFSIGCDYWDRRLLFPARSCEELVVAGCISTLGTYKWETTRGGGGMVFIQRSPDLVENQVSESDGRALISEHFLHLPEGWESVRGSSFDLMLILRWSLAPYVGLIQKCFSQPHLFDVVESLVTHRDDRRCTFLDLRSIPFESGISKFEQWCLPIPRAAGSCVRLLRSNAWRICRSASVPDDVRDFAATAIDNIGRGSPLASHVTHQLINRARKHIARATDTV